MKQKFENLGQILGRDVQKNIKGGTSGVCAIRITGGDYGSTLGAINFGSGNPSAAANSFCSDYVSNNGGRCQYDCVYDGLQSSWATEVIA